MAMVTVVKVDGKYQIRDDRGQGRGQGSSQEAPKKMRVRIRDDYRLRVPTANEYLNKHVGKCVTQADDALFSELDKYFNERA